MKFLKTFLIGFSIVVMLLNTFVFFATAQEYVMAGCHSSPETHYAGSIGATELFDRRFRSLTRVVNYTASRNKLCVQKTKRFVNGKIRIIKRIIPCKKPPVCYRTSARIVNGRSVNIKKIVKCPRTPTPIPTAEFTQTTVPPTATMTSTSAPGTTPRAATPTPEFTPRAPTVPTETPTPRPTATSTAFVPRNPNGASSLAAPTNLTYWQFPGSHIAANGRGDHFVSLIWSVGTVTGLSRPDSRLPSNISGYLLTYWKVSQPDKIFTKLTTEKVAQIQGLPYGEDFNGYVQSVGFFGETSNISNIFTFQSAPASEVLALKTKYNAFFDTFDRSPMGTMGAFDGLKWSAAYSMANATLLNRSFINNQEHAHNLCYATFSPNQFDALYDRGSNTNRVLNAVCWTFQIAAKEN